MYAELAVLTIFIAIYSLVAGRIERAAASGPIVFVTVGFIMGPTVLGWFDGDRGRDDLRVLADLTLATVLFIDAANANTSILRKHFQIPGRMLLIGLPGAIALGTIGAMLIFDLPFYIAAILGTMLAATDAALGKAVVTNKLVPERVRESLNAESGLNDGLCVPVLLVFIALAVGANEGSGTTLALTLVAEELGIGLLVGCGIAFAGSRLLHFCIKQGWVTEIWMQVTAVAIAIACFATAQSVHGSGYIAAFTGGLLFGFLEEDGIHKLVHAAEGVGETLALMTWMLFGAVVLTRYFDYLTWEMLVYAFLSLTLFRMLPIYLSLWGTHEKPAPKLFLGWFGPRGLASIVFGIIVLERNVPEAKFLGAVVVLTVFLSLVLHGISANPLARSLSEKMKV